MMKTGPTKVIVKHEGLYEATTGKLIKDGLATRKAIEDYAAHHYIALPVVDRAGRAWSFEGKPVDCLHGTQYETLDQDLPHARPCPDCGGLALPIAESALERDCVRCTQCGHEFEPRLEMMES
jgi:rubredoxin